MPKFPQIPDVISVQPELQPAVQRQQDLASVGGRPVLVQERPTISLTPVIPQASTLSLADMAPAAVEVRRQREAAEQARQVAVDQERRRAEREQKKRAQARRSVQFTSD